MTYDQFLAAICLWREARGSSLPTLTAIYWVILNRTTDSQHRWPRTIPGVVMQPRQFSSMTSPGDPNLIKLPIDNGSPDWTAFQSCLAAIGAPGGDPTSGATNYESLPEPVPKPSWADPSKITLTLGPFRFYRL